MTKRNLLKLLIIFLAATTVAGKSYAAETEMSIRTTSQGFVAIEKDAGSKETTTLTNVEKGTHEGLISIFNLQTNGTDSDYDFLLSSQIISASGTVSAFSSNGYILFAHTLTPPTDIAVENAKSGGNNNQNVIAYPVTVTVSDESSLMSIDYNNSNATYGDCYELKLNGGTEGTITHSVSGTPVAGTYNVGQDQEGSYRSVIMLTAIPKAGL